MTDFLRLLVVFAAAINPAGVLIAMRSDLHDEGARLRGIIVAVAAALALVLYALAVVLSGRIMDGLAIDAESFRLAAAIVLLVAGIYAIWTGVPGSHAPGPPRLAHGLFPLGVPLLAGPAGLVAAISYAVDISRWQTFIAATIWITITALLLLVWRGRWPAAVDGIARVTGGLLVIMAVALAISGIKAV